MNRFVTFCGWFSVVACLFGLPHSAAAAGQGPQVTHAFSPAPPASARVATGYFEIENTGPDDVLLSAQTPIAKKTSLHMTEMVDSIMRMRPIEGGVPVLRGQKLRFRPGGRHLMLSGLRRQLLEGERFPVFFSFKHAGSQRADFIVQRPGSQIFDPSALDSPAD